MIANWKLIINSSRVYYIGTINNELIINMLYIYVCKSNESIYIYIYILTYYNKQYL